MKVADLTVEELRALVRDVVVEVLEERECEDDGELRPEFEAELLASLKSREEGVPLDAVAKELGVEL